MYNLYCFGVFAGAYRSLEEVEKRKRELADEERGKIKEDPDNSTGSL